MKKGDFFRYCRIVHGWLSALAFLLLCFFSFTGMILNHPGWLSGNAPPPVESKLTLTTEELDAIREAEVPGEKLAELVSEKTDVKGGYSSGDQVGRELFVRLRGVRGQTDIRAHMPSGNVTVIAEGMPTMSILNELHRGEHAGAKWRLLIDVTAIVLIVLSIIGFMIFLSLRFRLRTALILMAASTIGAVSLFLVAVA